MRAFARAKSTLTRSWPRGTVCVVPLFSMISNCDASSLVESETSIFAIGQPSGPGTSTWFDQDILLNTYAIAKMAMHHLNGCFSHVLALLGMEPQISPIPQIWKRALLHLRNLRNLWFALFLCRTSLDFIHKVH